MSVVMADVQQDALEKAVAEVRALGAPVVGFRVDVSKAAEVEALAETTTAAFGAPHFVFNNAGVGAGGLILGEHGQGLGMGRRRQPDGRRAACACSRR